MFWTYGMSVSTMEQLLDKTDGVTLDEVLKESELIQELRNHNDKLITFLIEDENIKKIIDYIILADNIVISNICVDILMCSVSLIDHTIFEESSNLMKLWLIIRNLENIDQINRILRIFIHYASFKTRELLDFYKNNQIDFINDLLNGIHILSVRELILRFISNKMDECYLNYQDELCKNNFVIKLIQKISIENTVEVAEGSSSLICDIIRICRLENTADDSIIFEQTFFNELFKDETLNLLIDNIILSLEQPFISIAGMSVLCNLFNLQRCGTSNGDEFFSPSYLPSKFMRYNKQDFTKFSSNIERLLHILSIDHNTYFQNAAEQNIKMFGKLRLLTLEALISIMLNNNEIVSNEFARLNFPIYIMGLFDSYPENNLLHSLVELAITCILMGYRWKSLDSSLLHVDDILLNSLFKDEKFIKIMVDLSKNTKSYSAHIIEIQRSLRTSLADSYHSSFILVKIDNLSQETRALLFESEQKLEIIDEKELVDHKFLQSINEDMLETNDGLNNLTFQSFISIEKALESLKLDKSSLIFNDIPENFEVDMNLDPNIELCHNPFYTMNIQQPQLNFNHQQIVSFVNVINETVDDVVHSSDSIDNDNDSLDRLNYRHSSDHENDYSQPPSYSSVVQQDSQMDPIQHQIIDSNIINQDQSSSPINDSPSPPPIDDSPSPLPPPIDDDNNIFDDKNDSDQLSPI